MGHCCSSPEYQAVSNTEVTRERRSQVFDYEGTRVQRVRQSIFYQNVQSQLPVDVQEDFNAHVAAGKAMDVLLMEAKGTCEIEQGSVYGAAVALPQYARTAGWSLHYTALALRSYTFLIANILLQGFLLYMISKEERINDKFGKQMHLCNMGAGIPNCPDAPDCVGPRGSMYTPERLYDWKMWAARVFVRDSFAALFPDRIDEINELVDPGEYGLESYYLRLACVFLFVMGLWPDLMGSWHLTNLLYYVPTAPEAWMVYLGSEDDQNVKTNHHSIAEASGVDFRVAGMPLHWKLINFVFVVVPKMYIWVLMMDVGTLFLMETAGIEDMILNAVALSFILSIDELIFIGLFSETSKQMLELCEPLPLFEAAESEGELETYERHQMHRQWSIFSFTLFKSVFSPRLFCMLIVTIFFQCKYYQEHCNHREDGSWIGEDLYLPMYDTLSFWSFIYGPLPHMFPVAGKKEPIWTAPESLVPIWNDTGE